MKHKIYPIFCFISKEVADREVGVFVQNSDKEAGDNTDVESDDGMHDKTYTVNPNKNKQESAELFIPSDEEFPENTFEVGRTLVSNYYNSKETIIDYSKIPDDIFEEGTKFTATPTSLNIKWCLLHATTM